MGEKEGKKKEESQVLYAFVTFSVNYERRGWTYQNGGLQIAIFKILKLGLPEQFRSRVASGGSNPARLGELGNSLLPPFPIHRRREPVVRIPNPLGYAFQLFWVKKNCFREENQSQGDSVTLSRRFHKQIHEGFPSFFTVLYPFFICSSFFNG